MTGRNKPVPPHNTPTDTDDDSLILGPDHEHATAEMYPRLWNGSTGMLYERVLRALAPEPTEYLTIPMTPRGASDRLCVAVSQWNMHWEAAQFRRRISIEDLPPQLYSVADRGDYNVMFVPRTKSRYYEYSPLFHLLSKETVERFGLPLLRGGQWPYLAEYRNVDNVLPEDFPDRLSRAWSSTVWRHLMPGSPVSGFTTSDPIRLLSHNLDFWLPAVTEVIHSELQTLPLVDNGIPEMPATLLDGSRLEGAMIGRPRMGADVWQGQEDAAYFVDRTVEEADTDGRLRGILDAVRSNRVEDDFSDRWTYAREDFERKLYRKRNKIKVRFVELTDTILVQGPETEIVDRIVYGDFLALLNERDREVVVLLRSGITNLTEIANIMGYSNHSPISKRLKRIREQAANHFESM
ncbi:sigma-70 family RNA polymerase sigma factor [Nocardia sp. NPDC058058]|uniref:sigma-70 family RNA polymerase sigma factor n=1 Tax=Nocardia sp. NPDC058058 TaxID=3346317 RepID=UPI0036DD9ABD